MSKRATVGTYYYLLGSVLKVVDSSGTVKNSYYYDPYGNSLNKSEIVTHPWQFASGYFDANTGLYKFGTRYYDPQLGRWTQKDPVGGSVGKIGSGNRMSMRATCRIWQRTQAEKFLRFVP